jgi:hypothetical protein
MLQDAQNLEIRVNKLNIDYVSLYKQLDTQTYKVKGSISTNRDRYKNKKYKEPPFVNMCFCSWLPYLVYWPV